MWTSYFVVLVPMLLVCVAVWWVSHLFPAASRDRRKAFLWVVGVLAATLYTGWRAFW